MNFQGDRDDELTEKLTKKGIECGIMPAQLWAMPTIHIRFMFFDPPSDDNSDRLAVLAEQNAGRAKPFIPLWFFSER